MKKTGMEVSWQPDNMEYEHKFAGRGAVITGASRGIGRAIAIGLAAKGADVALLSRHYDKAEEAASYIRDMWPYARTYPYSCDVRDHKQVLETFEDASERLNNIHILVNNAGINARRALNPEAEGWMGDFEDSLRDWEDELATNLTGTYICSYVAAGYMLRQGQGSIINISSIKGKEPTSSPGYGASKAGVIKLTRDFAKSLGPHGIRVNCIAPGFIDTGMTAELPDKKKRAYKSMIPQGRFGDVGEVAMVVSFLASGEAEYINGACIDVNGGYLMD